MIKKIFLLISIVLGFIFISCNNNITDPGKSSPSVQFSLDKTGQTAQVRGLLGSLLKTNQLNPGLLLKAANYDEVKIICLDMTKYKQWNDFLLYWETNEQNSLIDYTLWDSTRDVIDNIGLILKQYPGTAYDYVGDYSFSIKDSIAKGTVYLNPGLNDFIFAVRSGGKTVNFSETQAIITKDSVNNIKLNFSNQPTGNPPNSPSSPHPPDFQNGVFRTATLTWVCSDPNGDPLTYNVYMGTSYNNITLTAANLPSAQYSPTLMQANTLYYWYIVAMDNNGNYTAGPLWQFTTGTQ